MASGYKRRIMVKAILDNKLRIKKSDLTQEQLRTIREKFSFLVNNESVQLHQVTEHLVILPPNVSYVKEFIPDLEVKDIRKFETIDSTDFNCELRPHQEQWMEDFKDFDYDAILRAATSTGKTFAMMKLQSILKVPMLFVAYQTTHLNNMMREIEEHHQEANCVKITGKWDGQLSDFNFCTVQLLAKRPDIAEMLSDRGIIVLDEAHLILGGEQFRNALYNISCKYKIAMSATPDVKEDGFIQAAWSGSIVTTDESNAIPVTVLPIKLNFPSEFEYMGGDAITKKKAYGLHKPFVKSLMDSVEHLVKDRGRSIMIYNDLNTTQETYKEMCDKIGIDARVVNNNTDKKDLPKILKEFEEGKFQVLINGIMIRESTSINRLSVIILTSPINCDSLHNRNGLSQLYGRLKRMKESVSTHKKVFIDLIFSGFESQYYSREAVYKKTVGATIAKTIESENTNFRHILERG
jgi:superfamily II DNA or RNA helicase